MPTVQISKAQSQARACAPPPNSTGPIAAKSHRLAIRCRSELCSAKYHLSRAARNIAAQQKHLPLATAQWVAP
jgi:hypothetical protein